MSGSRESLCPLCLCVCMCVYVCVCVCMCEGTMSVSTKSLERERCAHNECIDKVIMA